MAVASAAAHFFLTTSLYSTVFFFLLSSDFFFFICDFDFRGRRHHRRSRLRIRWGWSAALRRQRMIRMMPMLVLTKRTWNQKMYNKWRCLAVLFLPWLILCQIDKHRRAFERKILAKATTMFPTKLPHFPPLICSLIFVLSRLHFIPSLQLFTFMWNEKTEKKLSNWSKWRGRKLTLFIELSRFCQYLLLSTLLLRHFCILSFRHDLHHQGAKRRIKRRCSSCRVWLLCLVGQGRCSRHLMANWEQKWGK